MSGLGGVSTKWWNQFFETTFFGPIYAFYIYLAVLTATAGGGIKGRMAVTASTATGDTVRDIFPTNSFLADGIKTYTAASATGTGNITASFTGASARPIRWARPRTCSTASSPEM